jgi:uncharacterized protein (DUF1800 family)
MRKTLVLVGLVCCGAWASLGLAARAASKPQPEHDNSLFGKKLSRDQQVLQVLGRLTFGPQPGEVTQVNGMGLKKWIDLQLHPEQIKENPEVEKHLAPLATLNLTQQEIAAEYPRPAAAAAQQGKASAAPISQLLPRRQIQALRNGTPEQRRALLASLPPDVRDQVLEALPAVRSQLGLAGRKSQQVLVTDLSQAKLYRAVYSNRQLQEVLADFWFNHFNVDVSKGADRMLVTGYERDAIRPHVLGKFRDLLEATANSPAMMFYLDNWQSVTPPPVRPNAKNQAKQAARGLNENYARELMELHTLGVDGGYTQQDIVEVARCFTGWTIDKPNQGGPFTYNDRTHDKGEKTVLGVTIPAGGGKEDGEKVLDILAAHPSTARFISKELAQRFVADDPPPALIAEMAKTFEESGGDIRAVLSTMFNSKEFLSQGAYRAKIKSPFEMIVSAIRATGAKVDAAMPLANQLNNLGEPLYRKLEPTGYSSANEEWVNSSALLARMNFALQLAQGKLQGVRVDPKRFAPTPAAAARQLLFTNATPQTLSAMNKALEDQKKKAPGHASEPANGALIAGLVLGSPDFQRR